MGASETIERLREVTTEDGGPFVTVLRRHWTLLLDIAEAAERLRSEYVTIEPWWAEWEQAEMEYAGSWACRWCDGEGSEGGPDSVRHFDGCPAIALDRALDALGEGE